jgi:hypothetical protein
MQKIALGFSVAATALASKSAYVDMFEEFVQTYERAYAPDEKQRRLEIFQANMQTIEETNSKNLSYTLGVTPFTDLTFEEFKAQYIGGVTPFPAGVRQNLTTFAKPADFVAPDSVDWVAKGAVSSVKNQGTCGSCWTFSATGALEGAMAVAGRKLVDLSQQELVDCDTGLLGGHGCKGGNPAQAFGWVKSNGMCASADYEYQCLDATAAACTGATCQKTKCATPALKAGGWFEKGDVTTYGMVDDSQDALEAAVARQPISVAIEADQPVFQHYKSGVLTDTSCGDTLDHGVLVVGYGTQSSLLSGSKKYWRVKNSWSSSWGDNGYINIARGSSATDGECGIRKMASYPTVAPASDDSVVV